MDRGRVTLLGDAAHPMPPCTGQGAVMALEDAAVLGRALAVAQGVEDGLQRYEAARHAARRQGARDVGARDPNCISPMIQPSRCARWAPAWRELRTLYDYDAGSVILNIDANARQRPGRCNAPLAGGKAPQVRVGRETAGRGGKGVSVITGLPLAGDALTALATQLKKRCGSGGTVRDGVIEIQGDHRDLLGAGTHPTRLPLRSVPAAEAATARTETACAAALRRARLPGS